MEEIEHKYVQAESDLLKALSLRENFDQYSDSLNKRNLLEHTRILLVDYERYFDRYTDETEIDFNKFYTHFSQNWHNGDMDSEDVAYYRDLVIPSIQAVHDSRIANSLLLLEERKTVEAIRKELRKGIDADKIIELVSEYDREYQATHNKVFEGAFTPLSVDLTKSDNTQGLEWFLPTLQSSLGSLTGGQFVLIVGGESGGKSAAVVHQTCKSLRQMYKEKNVRPILYYTSEDTPADLMNRIYSNLFYKQYPGGFEEIYHNANEVQERFAKAFGTDETIVAFNIEGAKTYDHIQNAIKYYNPALVVVDMLDAIAPDESWQELKSLYDRFRRLANQGYPILATSQAGDTYKKGSDGELRQRQYLTSKDCSGSNFAKQAAAYAMIMIGKDDTLEDVRYINITKKKRGKKARFSCKIIDRFSMYLENT